MPRAYSLAHLDFSALHHNLVTLSTVIRTKTADLVAHIAEFDARRFYVRAGYTSMRAYCMGELRLSEDSAAKHLQVARKAREFPALFGPLAEGRLHLSGARLLAPHLTTENTDDLIAAAMDRSMAEIELLLAERFPQSEPLPLVQEFPGAQPASPESVAPRAEVGEPQVKQFTRKHAARHVDSPVPRSQLSPIAKERFVFQLAIGKRVHDKLRHAQDLLSHAIPSGDWEQVLEYALDEAIRKLERQKFAATTQPRSPKRPPANQRSIPAHVRRAVRERDQGQCTFDGETGHRCGARKFLEFDHIIPVARGGEATVENLTLRCRVHNAFEAERTFGAGFMEQKREAARQKADARAATKLPAAPEEPTAEEARDQAAASAEQAIEQDFVSAFRNLGYRGDDLRRAAALCRNMPGVAIAERIRAALAAVYPARAVKRSANS